MQSKYPKEVDQLIHEYIISPYRLQILEVRNNHYKYLHGRDDKKIIKNIKLIQANMQMIEANIKHKHFKNLDILFRYTGKDAGEKLGIKEKTVSVIKNQIRSQFYDLMNQNQE